MDEISSNCAPLFHMVVHAALFPRFGPEIVAFASSLEEDECLDSLSQGGVLWDDLLYVWAFETGAANLEDIASGQGATIDATSFHEAIGELQSFFELEFSVPLHAMGQEGPLTWEHPPFDEMPPFDGQRLHLCKRSTWFPIDFTGISEAPSEEDDSEIEAATESGEAPLFAEPVHDSESSGRLGQVWVRASKHSQRQLKNGLPDTLESLAMIGHGRSRMLQDALHREQPSLPADRLRDLNAYVRMLRERANAHHDAATRLASIEDQAERQQAIEMFLELINSESARDSPETTSTKSIFISYRRESDEHCSWVSALSNSLTEHGFDVRIDVEQDAPEEGWPRWMRRGIESTDYVVCICTPDYRDRFDGKQNVKDGLGADYEGFLITQLLYECNSRNARVIPVLPESGCDSHIPLPLRSFTCYRLPRDLQRLLDRLARPRRDRVSGVE